MLSYSLRVVWFAVSLAGLLGSWAALPLFRSQLFLSGWVPLIYGAADTVLQGIFCLGLVWKMDPSIMPRAFCIAQTALIHVSWACLSGLCASVTLGTAAVTFSSCPRFFRTATRLPATVALVIVFPAIILVLQLALLLKLDAARPVNGMNCDASHPTWVRVLGYAGLTLLLSVPSFVLSLVTAIRLFFGTRQPSLHNSRPPSRAISTNASLMQMPDRRQRKRDSKSAPALDIQFTKQSNSSQFVVPSPLLLPKAYHPEGLGRAPTVAKHSKYHLPFENLPPPSLPQSRRSSTHSQTPSQMRDSPVLEESVGRHGSHENSPSPIIFAAESREGSQNNTIIIRVSPSPVPRFGADDGKEINSIIQVQPDDLDVGSDEGMSESLHWQNKPDRGSIAKTYDRADDEEGMGQYVLQYPRIRRFVSGQPPWLEEPPEPDPSLLRTAVFQLFTSSTLILASISSLVDIFSSKHTPSPLGTQHVALLLAAWGPCLFICIIFCQRSCSLTFAPS